MDKKRILKTSIIVLICVAAVIVMILLSGLQGSRPTAEKEGEGSVMILYTSDIHCGVDEGFGLACLKAVRDRFEEKGYETILVDNGDAIQGEALGMMTKGMAMIELMNAVGYDIAIPGNHDFDYGADRFLELAKKAKYPYICCNLKKDGELVFKPYIIKEVNGMKIAFVGVDTPQTITTSTPKYFQDESGKIVYDFMGGDNGQELYDAVQDAVDSARAEGADYVYVLGHLGLSSAARPWTYDEVIRHTNGIDVFLDGHSHDTEQVVMKNKDGKEVVRSACGTKMQAIGYSEISKEEGIKDTNIWSWNNGPSAPDLLGVDNSVEKQIQVVEAALNEKLDIVIGKADTDLTIDDPKEKYDDGAPVRMVRRAETNLGDFFADAAREQLGADISLLNGGALRTGIQKGDITYGNIIDVYPFSNDMCVIEVKGQQIVDALEWGARAVPDETGAFLQVSGLTYEIDSSIPSTCTSDEEGMFTGITGERRVRNVLVGGKPIDPDATYTVAGSLYLLQQHGDGFTMFDNASSINISGGLDSEVIIDYIKEQLGGEIREQYADPYGDGRITIKQ